MCQFPAETPNKLRTPSRSVDARCPDTVVERPVLLRTDRLKRLSICQTSHLIKKAEIHKMCFSCQFLAGIYLKQFAVSIFQRWKRDPNPRPADYKSAALPTELFQQNDLYLQSGLEVSLPSNVLLFIFQQDCFSSGSGSRTQYLRGYEPRMVYPFHSPAISFSSAGMTRTSIGFYSIHLINSQASYHQSTAEYRDSFVLF